MTDPRRILLAGVLFLGILGTLPAQGVSRAVQLYQEGLSLLDREEPYEAIILLKQSADLNRQYWEPLVALADAYYYLDEYDEALRWIERAKPLARTNNRLRNIEGRILLALGKTEEAATLFRTILQGEPYNVDAILGLAEFSLAKGDEITALTQYQKSLTYNNRDRRILLSLALLYEDQGNTAQSEQFLRRALDNFTDSPMVHTLAAEYYLRRGLHAEAVYHATTANTLAGNHIRALMALVRTYMEMDRTDDALGVLDLLINLDSRNAEVWYLRGQALAGAGRVGDAVLSLETALRISPSDEVARLVWENLLLAGFDPAGEERTRAGSWHYSQAQEYLKKNLYSRAGFHFNRGKLLSPFDSTGRLRRAEYYRTLGKHGLFLEELEALFTTLKVQTNYVKDNREIYQSLLSRTVAKEWKVEQYTLDRSPLFFRTYYGPQNDAQLEHSKASRFLAEYFQGLLGTNDKISFGTPLDDFAQELPRPADPAVALRMARQARADYYVVLSFEETDEDFAVVADLYLARTGNRIKTYRAWRTGNFRVQNAIWQVVEAVHADLPLRGTLIDRKVNTGLVSLGSNDGLKVGDILPMVSPDGYVLQGMAPGFEYSQEKQTGTFTVTRIDDKVAEGTIKREGFYDRTNLGDVVLGANKTVLTPQDATSNFPFLYNRIRGIR